MKIGRKRKKIYRLREVYGGAARMVYLMRQQLMQLRHLWAMVHSERRLSYSGGGRREVDLNPNQIGCEVERKDGTLCLYLLRKSESVQAEACYLSCLTSDERTTCLTNCCYREMICYHQVIQLIRSTILDHLVTTTGPRGSSHIGLRCKMLTLLGCCTEGTLEGEEDKRERERLRKSLNV